ncbi:MAG: vWA domain-containing protein [Planctomycetota bacterium]
MPFSIRHPSDPDLPTGDVSARSRSVPVSKAWIVSLLTHSIVLIVLALWVMPPWTAGTGVSLNLQVSEQATDELLSFRINAAHARLEPSPERQSDSLNHEVRMSEDLLREMETWEIRAPLADVFSEVPEASTGSGEATSEDADAARTVQSAAGVADAMSSVEGAIRGELSKGDLMVAWLFDSSTSLRQNRMEMAAKAKRFFRELKTEQESKANGRGVLSGTVMAFGRRYRELIAPTSEMADVVAAMRRVPTDTSGVENVMGAVQQAVKDYRVKSGSFDRVMVVILTDESGDDFSAVDDAIELCNAFDVRVHVIGPTAAFGRWKTRQVIDSKRIATVMKGPEAIMPQSFNAGFWFDQEDPALQFDVNKLPWYGGVFRDRLPSGFGPYALTRLTLGTHGSYTMFDRGATDPRLGNYDTQVMLPYAPSYQPVADFQAAIKRSRLRSFVMQAAAMSAQTRLWTPPPARLPLTPRSARPSGFAPMPRGGGYDVAQSIRVYQEILVESQRRLTRALTDSSGVDWEAEYDQETSPRWRAMFDLNRGRMIAWSVRIAEYLAANRSLNPSSLRAETVVRWQPSERLTQPSSPVLRQEALLLLRRCVQDHAGTPWASLAQWELDVPMGVEVTVGG